MKCTDNVAFKDISVTQPKSSRKDPSKKYVFVTLKNNDEFVVETPKMRVSNIHMLDQKMSIDLDLTSGIEKSMIFYLQNIYSLFESKIDEIDQRYRIDKAYDSPQTFSLKIKSYPNTLLFDNESRKEITEHLRDRFQKLSGRNIKTIARLDGLIIDEKHLAIKPVWSVDQILLFEDAPINPFGKNYCFIEDDDGYLSLDD